MSCKIILWRTLKCVLLLIAQLSNYFCAHYSEKWQYWERECALFPPAPPPCCTHWHPQEHTCLVKSLMKIKPSWWDIYTSTIDDSQRQASLPSTSHTYGFALKHTIFIVKFKNLIHGTQQQGHSQAHACLYFIHHLPGWFLFLIESAGFEPSTEHTGSTKREQGSSSPALLMLSTLTDIRTKMTVFLFKFHYSTFTFGC